MYVCTHRHLFHIITLMHGYKQDKFFNLMYIFKVPYQYDIIRKIMRSHYWQCNCILLVCSVLA
jgi:hypothetical protein